MGKQSPLKAVHTLQRKREREKSYSLVIVTEPTQQCLQELDVAHQRESVTYWCSEIQFSPFIGALLFPLYKDFKKENQLKHFGRNSVFNFQNVYMCMCMCVVLSVCAWLCF